MGELNDTVVTEAENRGETLLVEDLVRLIQQYERPAEPGVERARIEEYVVALTEEGGLGADAEGAMATVEEVVVDSRTWEGDDALYAIDEDRISAYPAGWHERLGGSTDLRRYVEVMQEELSGADADTSSGGLGEGVPETHLLDAATVLGGMDREEARHRLKELRDAGTLVADADQHPKSRIRLAE